MLLMLDQASASVGPMESLEEARLRAMEQARALEQGSQMSVDGNIDESSPQSWTRVTPGENPNAEDLP